MAKTKAKPQAAPDDKTETFTQSLKVQLTPAEVADRADRAAQMIAERDAKEEEQKAAAKHAKSVIESLDAEIRRLSNEVRTRSTYSPVECQREWRYGDGIFREVRNDTGEELINRRLTDAERQLNLPFAENGEGGYGDSDA